MSNFESSVKVIPYSQERVYNKLSDLSNLEAVKDRLPKDKVQDLSFDSDTLSFSVSPIGQLTLQIVERDPCKCIKLATTNSPLPFNMWIQLVETAEEECKVKVTIGMDLNPFMKAMVQKPLQEGLEKMVDMLAGRSRFNIRRPLDYPDSLYHRTFHRSTSAQSALYSCYCIGVLLPEIPSCITQGSDRNDCSVRSSYCIDSLCLYTRNG